jgi:hypothetical protein
VISIKSLALTVEPSDLNFDFGAFLQP